MAAALRAGPELIGCPGHAGPRVAHVHLCATSLTTNMACEVGHREILASYDPCVIPAIVLAAGKSTRMGRLKANLPVGPVGPVGPVRNDTFLTRLVKTLREA